MSVKHTDKVESQIVQAGTGTQMQVLISAEEGPNFAMRRFSMEPGGGMPLHTNLVEHEQYVLRGRARIGIGDEEFEVQQGNVVFIPGGAPHYYQNIGDGPFEFLCLVPHQPDEIVILD